jgi:hypothetical protein
MVTGTFRLGALENAELTPVFDKIVDNVDKYVENSFFVNFRC